MAALSHFSDVLEEKLNAQIQKAAPEKIKTATKYDIKIFKSKKKMNLRYQFNSFT